MSKIKLILGIILIIAFTSFPPVVHASYAARPPDLNIDQLIEHSDIIVVGKVTGYESYLERDQTPYTDTLLEVQYYLQKAVSQDQIRVKSFGGEVLLPDGSKVMTVEDEKIESIGDKVCVFLKKDTEGRYRLLLPNGLLYLTKGYPKPEDTMYAKAFKLEKVYPTAKYTKIRFLFIILTIICVVIIILNIKLHRQRGSHT